MARVGGTINAKYSLQRTLGQGGMGEVFAAQNLWTGRTVAIKTLRAEHAKERQFVERFWQEARCASALRHRNIVDVLDVGIDDATGEPFIVQEHLEGQSLDRALSASPDGRLPVPQALGVVLPLMDALAACHEAGLIHRDIKPSNVILARAPDGEIVPKLIDFGVSKSLLTRGPARTLTGVVVGTPQYMSPEQARGDGSVDARADVWAMGVMLFELLSGRIPFDGPSVHVIVAQVLHAEAPPLRSVAPHVPDDIAAAVDRALCRDRDARFQSMRAFLAELHACELPRRERALAPPQTPAPAWAEGAPQVNPTPPKRMVPARLRIVAATAVFTFGFVAALSALRGPYRVERRTLTPSALPAVRPAPALAATPPAPSLPEPSPAPPLPPAVSSERARHAAPRRATSAPPRISPRAPDPLAPDERPYAAIRRRGVP